MRPIILAMMLTTAFSTAMPAAAALYRFDVTDPDATLGGQSIANYYFLLDPAVTPRTNVTATQFTMAGLTYSHTFSDNVTLDSFTFYTTAGGGGFDDFENVYEGPQLFTGTTANPIFTVGTFPIDDFVTNGSVKISLVGAATSAVPEPASWAMMIGGLGIAGAALRRRAKVAVRFA